MSKESFETKIWNAGENRWRWRVRHAYALGSFASGTAPSRAKAQDAVRHAIDLRALELAAPWKHVSR